MSQKDHERALFVGFAGVLRARGHFVDLDSVRQLDPPYPDIVCEVDGVSRGFELTSATNESVQQDVAHGEQPAAWMGGEAVAAYERK